MKKILLLTERQIKMAKFIDKIKGFFSKISEFCKEKTKKIKWKVVWDKVTTGLLIFVLSSPLLILAYIMIWFFTRQQF